jgi:D-serine deaminase-like pyridoxal phosphate-dependent protein
VSEVRAGVYVFHDLVMLNLGAAAREELALSVLGSVIGHQAEKGWVSVDAGWMAMSRDRGTRGQALDYGYGAVCDETGDWIEDLILHHANQEHGILCLREGATASDLPARFPLGTRLRILPNHACATAAQHAHYAAIATDQSVSTWNRFSGR